MNGFVPIQGFRHQPLDGPPDLQLVAHPDLVLDRGVHGGVHLLARQGNAGASTVLQHQVQAFLFVETEPSFGVRSEVSIIGALDVEVLILVLDIRTFESINTVFKLAKFKTAGAEPSAQEVHPPPDLVGESDGPGM